jgi:branched-chain amino acid transport system permease protein
LAIITLFWAYLGQSWNILGGYAGQFSFGHSAYFGIGAYASTLLLLNQGVNPWIGMIVGGMTAMVFGLLVGYLSFRSGLRGFYFALVTIAFAEILLFLSLNLEFVNKSMGLQIPLRGGNFWFRFQFETTIIPYYYIMLGLVIMSLFAVRRIEQSKLGYYLRAIHEDEEAASTLAVNPLFYKMAAMGISCFMTALGGTFYAQYFFFIDPDLVFGVDISIGMILRAIVGGYGTLWGPLMGAALLTPLSEITRSIIRNQPGIDVMMYGVMLIIFIIFVPQGSLGWIRGIQRRARRKSIDKSAKR